PERYDDQSDRAEGEPEAQMQIGADIGEGTPSDARLDEHGENDEARPRVGEHGDIVGNETARGLLAVAGRARARVGQQLEHLRSPARTVPRARKRRRASRTARRARRPPPGRTAGRKSAPRDSARAPAGGARS